MSFNDIWKKFLEEASDPQFVDVSSLKMKDQLAPGVWEQGVLRPTMRDQAVRIANEFFDSLELDPDIILEDITLTGSLATYNWSDLSDFDLHILIDFEKLKNLPLMEDYFKQKIRNWNKAHKILFDGYEVEIYIQDSNEPHYANGIYSILNNDWIKRPSKFRNDIDFESVKKKAAQLMDEIDNVYDYYAEKDYRGALDMSESLMTRIKKYRQMGLQTDGINSIENLVFKVLRRNEYLHKLSSLRILAYDALMSVKGSDLDEISIKRTKDNV